MRTCSLVLSLSVLLPIAARAQQSPDLLVYGFGGTTANSLPDLPQVGGNGWLSETDNGKDRVVLCYNGAADGSNTMLLAHCTLREYPTDARMQARINTVLAIYPFLRRPDPAWHTQFVTMLGDAFYSTTTLEQGDTTLVIPPSRVVTHVQRMQMDSAPSARLKFGPANTVSANNPITDYRYYIRPIWTTSDLQGMLQIDERQAWADPTAWEATPALLHIFRPGKVGFDAAGVAAQIAVNNGTISAAALTNLKTHLETEYGFEIHVQAVHHQPSTANPPTPTNPNRIKLSQSARLRRLSVKEITSNAWHAAHGGFSWVPSIFDTTHRIYFGSVAGEMHVEVNPSAYPGVQWNKLQVYLPTAQGYVLAPRLDQDNPAKVVRCSVPASAISGNGYVVVEEPYGPGTAPLWVKPVGGYAAGITFTLYVPAVLPPAPPQ